MLLCTSTMPSLALAWQDLQALGAACRSASARLQHLCHEHDAKAAALAELRRGCAERAAALSSLFSQHENARAFQAQHLQSEHQLWLQRYKEERLQCISELACLRKGVEARCSTP